MKFIASAFILLIVVQISWSVPILESEEANVSAVIPLEEETGRFDEINAAETSTEQQSGGEVVEEIVKNPESPPELGKAEESNPTENTGDVAESEKASISPPAGQKRIFRLLQSDNKKEENIIPILLILPANNALTVIKSLWIPLYNVEELNVSLIENPSSIDLAGAVLHEYVYDHYLNLNQTYWSAIDATDDASKDKKCDLGKKDEKKEKSGKGKEKKDDESNNTQDKELFEDLDKYPERNKVEDVDEKDMEVDAAEADKYNEKKEKEKKEKKVKSEGETNKNEKKKDKKKSEKEEGKGEKKGDKKDKKSKEEGENENESEEEKPQKKNKEDKKDKKKKEENENENEGEEEKPKKKNKEEKEKKKDEKKKGEDDEENSED